MTPDDLSRESRIFLSTLPPGRSERRLAMAVALVSAALFLAVVPFAQLPLPAVPAFIPVYQSAIVIGDLITAALLFGQFAILRSRGLFVLACAYQFSALIAAVHMLTFPGLFSPSGLLGSGPQTTAWLYMFWHGGFPLLIIAYVLSERGNSRPITRITIPTLTGTAIVAMAVLGCWFLAAESQHLLPDIMQGNRYTATMMTVVSSVWALSMLALAVLWPRRRRSVLDLWLIVIMCAWVFDIALSAVFNAGRYDLGFYAGRIYGLSAALFLLIVLLLENGVLYARLAQALDVERDERRSVQEKTAEVNELNAQLEQRVRARTADLEAANQEMRHEAMQRERAELKSLETHQRLAGIIDSAMDAVITVDETQRIVLFNAAAEAIFRCSQKDAIGAPLDRFIPERYRAAHSGHLRDFGETNVASRRMSTQRVVTGLRHDGEEFPIDAAISHLTLHDHHYYTVILRDVTERLRAEEALRRSREDLHEIAAVGATAREQEKVRIARELHDELAQSLTALKMDLALLKKSDLASEKRISSKLAVMDELLDRTILAVRRIAADLRPLMLDDLGFIPAVHWLVDNFKARHDIHCELVVTPPEFALSDPYSTAVFRIMQEALVNVARHSRATRVEVDLIRADGYISLRVCDNGNGFDRASPRKANSFGLVGLRERAYLADGELRIDTAPGLGTTIEVRIPVPAEVTDSRL